MELYIIKCLKRELRECRQSGPVWMFWSFNDAPLQVSQQANTAKEALAVLSC